MNGMREVKEIQITGLSESIGVLAKEWLRTAPGLPFVVRVNPVDGSIEARIGLRNNSTRISATQAAELLGMSRANFYRNHYFGLARGTDRKFSRLQVERLRQLRTH